MRKINVSIVLYKNPPEVIESAVSSCLNSELIYRLYLLDNSPTDELSYLAKLDERVVYVFNNANMGFGKAHNIALRKSLEEDIPYHLVLNPDVYFEKGVLEELYHFMEKNKDVGLVMPKVLYPDGSLQYVCKLLPTPLDLIGRRFLNLGPFKKLVEKRNYIYELRFTGYDKLMEVPNLCGCFMFLRTKVLRETGLFDERFFLYLEDIDLSRRIHRIARTVYYPYVHIYHIYTRGSYKSFRLLIYHMVNAIRYFNKWGWFFDRERDRINRKVLETLEVQKKLGLRY